MLRKLLITALLLLPAAQPALAGEGEGKMRLDRFLSGLSTMRADFVQVLEGNAGDVADKTEGVLLLSRPGRFRLDYQKPYEQVYVADGERLWMYDKDLEQVTVRPQKEALGNTPALLLSGSEPLDRNFEFIELGSDEGVHLLELRPKNREEANFEYVRLALEGDVLRGMEMADGLGQITRLYFDTVERNPDLGKARFEFTPPPGVDVVGDTP